MNILGIEIGGSKLQLALGDATANVLAGERFAVDRAEGAAGIRAHIESALPRLLAGRRLAAVGVGFGGPVDWRTGRVCVSHQVEGWSGFDLAGWLGGLTGAPVSVDNDSNLAALGEATRGAGAGADPVFYFNLGSGVGGGLVLGGRVYHGVTPGEVEFGHLRLDRSGVTVEDRCSGWAMDARVRRVVATAPESLLARLIGGAEARPSRLPQPAAPRDGAAGMEAYSPRPAQPRGGEARHLAVALAGGDSAARNLLETLAADLAFALAHVVHLFHPQVLVMGGGLALLGEPLRAAVASALPGFVMAAFRPPPPLRLAQLGEAAVPTGALLLAAAARPTAAG